MFPYSVCICFLRKCFLWDFTNCLYLPLVFQWTHLQFLSAKDLPLRRRELKRCSAADCGSVAFRHSCLPSATFLVQPANSTLKNSTTGLHSHCSYFLA